MKASSHHHTGGDKNGSGNGDKDKPQRDPNRPPPKPDLGPVLSLPSDDATQIVARSLAVPVYVGLLVMLRVVAMSTIRSLMPSRR